VQSSGVGDTVFFGPEAEFFMFDDVRFAADPYNTGFKLDSTELPSNMDAEYEMGNMGHRPRTKGGYFPVRRSTQARTSAAKCWPSWRNGRHG
jgi:glutamine synthetase